MLVKQYLLAGVLTALPNLNICFAFTNPSTLINRRNALSIRIVITSKNQPSSLSMSAVGVDQEDSVVITDIDGVDKEEQAVLAPKTPTSTFGRPISDDMIKFNKAAVGFFKSILFDTLFSGRDYARFYALENIARMPYFSYLSVLHLYETLGMWRQKNYLKIHFAQEWNELHHLLIMEDLGGNEIFLDRMIAQTCAVAYYWIVFFLYLYNPTLAYNINEEIERHAYNTYDQFLKENGEMLKELPAPQVAKDYYRDGDLYMFDEFQTRACEPRRPACDTLFDVFTNIRDDEAEHCKTMKYLQAGIVLNTINDDNVEDECELDVEGLAP